MASVDCYKELNHTDITK